MCRGLPTTTPARPKVSLLHQPGDNIFPMERYRIHSDGAVYFVTYSVVDWLPVFVSEAACRIISDSLKYCHNHKRLRINAYVIMPTHFHAIVFDQQFDSERLLASLSDFRKFTGRNCADYCLQHMPKCFTDVFRHAAGGDRQRQFWQSTRHPEQVETQPFWQQKLEYIHENPYRKGLVTRQEHWRFSSARYWLDEIAPENDVILTALEW